jgi:hypothetical protein
VTTPTVTLPTPTGAASPIPTPSQAPTATPISSPVQTLLAWLSTNWPLAAVLCLIPLLILGLVCVLWILRRKPRAVPSPPPPTPRPVPARAHLESAAPGSGPRLFDLKPQGITIGRGQENDLVITHDFPGWETVSRHHVRVCEQGGRWVVEDLDSTNGVYVNGRRTGHNLLREGWRLGVGGVEFIFHADVGEA